MTDQELSKNTIRWEASEAKLFPVKQIILLFLCLLPPALFPIAESTGIEIRSQLPMPVAPGRLNKASLEQERLLNLGQKTVSKVTSGLYWEIQPTPIFYDRFLPLILQYKTPSFNKTEVTFNNWYNCTSEFYPYALSCPIVFHLNTAVRFLHIDFENLVPGSSDQQSGETVSSQEDFIHALTSHTSFCTRIQSHFPGLYINKSDFQGYLNRLKLCSGSTTTATTNTNTNSNSGSGLDPDQGNNYYMETNLTDYRYNIRLPFTKIESNFYDKFYRPVATASELKGQNVSRLLASAVLSNSRTAIQGSVLASFYAERNRWHFAVLNCQQGKLPANIVTEEKLKGILTKLEGNLTQLGFSTGSGSGSDSEKLTLSIPLSSLSKYYSLPLTDCTHTEDELVVRILVPLTSASKVTSRSNSSTSEPGTSSASRSRFSLRTVHPIPFVFGDKLCKLKHVQDGSVYLFDEEDQAAYEYDVGRFCDNGQGHALCSVDISSLAFYGRKDLCVGSVFSGDVGQLREWCPWECQSRNVSRVTNPNQSQSQGQSSTSRSPINPSLLIQKISTSQVVISKGPGQVSDDIASMHLSCEHTVQFFDLLNQTRRALREFDGAINFQFNCAGCTLFLGQSSRSTSRIIFKTFHSGLTKQCSINSTLYTIFQTVPWSLLKREKSVEILSLPGDSVDSAPSQIQNQIQDQALSQGFPLNVNWTSVIDYELINFLAKVDDFESAPAIQSHSQSPTEGERWWPGGDNEILAGDSSSTRGRHTANENQGENGVSSRYSDKLMWSVIIILLVLVIILAFSHLLMIKKLKDMEGKSYFPSVPERVSYRRASPILLEDEEIMDRNRDRDHDHDHDHHRSNNCY